MTEGVPNDHTTLTEVLRGFAGDGFSSSFEIEDDGRVRCVSCGEHTAASDVPFQSMRRLEGASDPADMATVIATHCPHCGTRGVIVARYGPEASAGEAQLLTAGRDRRRDGDGFGDAAPGEDAHDVRRLDPDAPGRSLYVTDEDAVEPNEPA
jgi:hypothetical protein